ncbi:outer membrane protein assembly factor BamD [Fluviispira sanaruensis]|uniref:Outer membrane protein assembly factor BamD n=1 Tax=Fluviispira sanaruensis TaxID=2493639 RepID=A0A4P2VXC7_FLUSA|nr:outer membrane protein assembly factor BamD [Fluviispira sanaruensis]BBH54295.1 outer membrane protein assembly factor BamD [Fluviispira sanaruensis]
MKIRNLITLIALSTSVLILNACQTIPIGEMSQDEGFTLIRNSYKSESWTDVITSVDEYKIRYPYSKFNVEADLMQADAYYQADRYPESIVAYEDFIRKNPNNPSVVLAHYRIAVAYDFQAPTAVDKEQLNAKKSIAKYSFYVKNFQNAEHVNDAKNRIEVLTRRLAEHEKFIADFYLRKEQYSAALERYLSLTKSYRQYADLIAEANEKIVECYANLATQLEKDPKSEEYITFKNTSPDELRKKAEEYKKKI